MAHNECPQPLHRAAAQLKIDAQSRQIKRQAEDLAALRRERELQLVRSSRPD